MTETLTLTARDFLSHVSDIVRDRGGDFVYPKSDAGNWPACRYDQECGCRCLIGEVASRMGVSDATLFNWTIGTDAGSVDQLVARGVIDTDRDTGLLMSLAQTLQDQGAEYRLVLAALEAVSGYDLAVQIERGEIDD